MADAELVEELVEPEAVDELVLLAPESVTELALTVPLEAVLPAIET